MRTRGKRAVKSLAAEREFAEMLVQIVASANAKDAKKEAALLSQLSMRLVDVKQRVFSPASEHTVMDPNSKPRSARILQKCTQFLQMRRR